MRRPSSPTASIYPTNTGGSNSTRPEGRRRTIAALLLAVLAIGATAPENASLTDITPDAVTRATTRSVWTGDPACLTDGRTPDRDPEASAIAWEAYGLVAVSWPDTVQLARIQVYVGKMARYRVFGYLGGGFSEEGHREGVETAVYGLQGEAQEGSEGWLDIPFGQEHAIDNLSFQVVDSAAIYEMRFLGPGDEVLQPRLACGRRGQPAR